MIRTNLFSTALWLSYSIMVDMSHYEKEVNLKMTRELVKYCNDRQKATEAEPGRIPSYSINNTHADDKPLNGNPGLCQNP